MFPCVEGPQGVYMSTFMTDTWVPTFAATDRGVQVFLWRSVFTSLGWTPRSGMIAFF